MLVPYSDVTNPGSITYWLYCLVWTCFFVYEMEIKSLTHRVIVKFGADRESTEQCAWHIMWPTNASCHLLFQGDPQTVLCFLYLPHSCLTGQALQNNCLLHFLKLALIAKNRIWPQKRNIPCLPIDSQVWEAKTILGSNFSVLRCNPGTAPYLRGRHIWK